MPGKINRNIRKPRIQQSKRKTLTEKEAIEDFKNKIRESFRK